ncbi:MAG: hypothetical protein DBX59_06470 [Bacillota bacterium]|nr:MAG: hypothetical protein DBX59_06470 [Bacillota bacterium]
MKDYLIGEKLGHSYSVAIHNAFGGGEYALKEIPRGELSAFFAAREFRGLNVTIPYKREAMALVEEISPLARRIGAINTVVNRGGVLFGDNTDYFGFSRLAADTGVDFKGKHVLILGTGGTSGTTEAVCLDAGAKSVCKVSRSGALDYGNVYERTETEIVVNTTPVGMYPSGGGRPVDLSRFPNLSGALDVIYNPLRTDFVLQAQSLGVPAAGGLKMLVAQAARARELFDGKKISAKTLSRVAAETEKRYENVVLIGMPGSGKSAVGKAVAAALGRPFYDCDEELVRAAGRSVEEIFARGGEEEFRAVEREVIADLAKKSGAVIATGGGAVKDSNNVSALRRNGRIYYLRRPTNLLALKGRPLSKNRETVEKLYEERRALYESAADCVIENDKDLQSAVFAALQAFAREGV